MHNPPNGSGSFLTRKRPPVPDQGFVQTGKNYFDLHLVEGRFTSNRRRSSCYDYRQIQRKSPLVHRWKEALGSGREQLTTLYGSGEAANGGDTLPPLAHIANPIASDGKVFVDTQIV